MDFTLTSSPDPGSDASDAQVDGASEEGAFTLSATPLVTSAEQTGARADELPRSYADGTLAVMARDPDTVFAYWDVDWSSAFGETPPIERTVHLRIQSQDGSEQELEVQPTARGQVVSVPRDNMGYVAELGFYNSRGDWRSVAKSALVKTPPGSLTGGLAAEIATVPFHLSFQQMLDALGASEQADEPLTGKLATLRAQDRFAPGDFNLSQRELVDAMESGIAHAPPASPGQTTRNSSWTQQQLEQILGFTRPGKRDNFAGSSHLGSPAT